MDVVLLLLVVAGVAEVEEVHVEALHLDLVGEGVVSLHVVDEILLPDLHGQHHVLLHAPRHLNRIDFNKYKHQK
jgi:hypothetical protein